MSFRRLLVLWAPVVAYSAVLYVLSAQRRPPGGDFVWDKVLHVAGYSVLGLLALRAFHGKIEPLRVSPTLLALLFTVGYGITDEIHQSFVPGRNASALDVVADALGFVLAVLIVRLRYSSFPRFDRGKA